MTICQVTDYVLHWIYSMIRNFLVSSLVNRFLIILTIVAKMVTILFKN